MPTHLFDHRAEQRENRAAWLGSLSVHAVLLAGLGYLSWTTLGPGTAKREPDDGPMVLGLTDDASGAGSENADRQAEDVADAPEGSADGGEGDDALAGVELGGAIAPLAALETSTMPLAPAPRLPLLTLGGNGVGSRRAAAPSPAGVSEKESGSGRPGSLGAQLDRLAERATVRVFGAVGEGSRFVYLFDHSTSMMGTPLAAAKRQLIESLDALSSVHQFHVIFFNHEVQAWDLTGGQERVPFASDANKKLAAQFLRTVVAVGGTDRVTPLRRALQFQPDVIFFLTDADDEMSHFDVADIVERAQGSGTEIACIEFGVGPDGGPRPREGGNFLTRLAAETGGDYVYVDTATLGR
jgi:hypothetical protein